MSILPPTHNYRQLFTSRVDDDGCVDCGGELDTEDCYLAFFFPRPSIGVVVCLRVSRG